MPKPNAMKSAVRDVQENNVWYRLHDKTSERLLFYHVENRIQSRLGGDIDPVSDSVWEALQEMSKPKEIKSVVWAEQETKSWSRLQDGTPEPLFARAEHHIQYLVEMRTGIVWNTVWEKIRDA